MPATLHAVFEVGQPAITGFNGDGNQTVLSLDASGTGSLNWIIIPQRASTEQGPTPYFVGGSILCAPTSKSCFVMPLFATRTLALQVCYSRNDALYDY